MDGIKLSVIIPVYNAEKHLRQALDSVLDQAFDELEIIAVDDGSIDGSYEILQSYENKDKRIKVLRQTAESKTAALARNMGIDASTGEYITFLDSDDFYEENAIETIMGCVEEHKADVTIFNGFIYDNDLQVDRINFTIMKEWGANHSGMFDGDDRIIHFLDVSTFAPWNKIYRRKFVIENKLRFRDVDPDDMEFGFLALSEASEIYLFNQRLIHYRRGLEDAQTSRYTKNIEAVYLPFVYLKEELVKRHLWDVMHVEFVRWFLMQFRAYTMQYKEYSLLETAYSRIQQGRYLDDFGIFDPDDSDLRSDILIVLRAGLKEKTVGEFLFYYTRQKDPVTHELNICLPCDREKRNQYRIVLYGAGMFGKVFRKKIDEDPMLELVCWVDKNYEEISKDVESPENIFDKEYDYVFIAVVSPDMFKDIRDYLINHGTPENRIIWMVYTGEK